MRWGAVVGVVVVAGMEADEGDDNDDDQHQQHSVVPHWYLPQWGNKRNS